MWLPVVAMDVLAQHDDVFKLWVVISSPVNRATVSRESTSTTELR